MAAGSTAVHGRVAPGFERVAEQFERNFERRGEVGAAFAATVDGRPVVDLWGGAADSRSGRAWDERTVVGVYSGSKGLVATCLLLLLDRGRLDLDAPVAAYWPQFAAHGKETIRVRHVVSHQAALPGLETAISNDEAGDHERIATLLAAQRPLAPPGTRFWYHALTFGWLCGELIRRVDGRTVGRFFAEEVARPLGLDAWIGLPPSEEPRVAWLERAEGFGAQKRSDAADGGSDPVAWSIWANPPRFGGGTLSANAPAWHAAEIPATNAIGSARALARLYGCLACGGAIDDRRLLDAATIELGRRCLQRGEEPYLQAPMAFGVGFQLQTEQLLLGPPHDAFGHCGTGGSAHGAWPSLRTGFSYAMNQLREVGDGDPRSTSLLEALHEAVSAARAAPAPVRPSR